MHRSRLSFLSVILASFGLFFSFLPSASANDEDFLKGVKHFKEFEVRPALEIFNRLAQDSSLSKDRQAEVALYKGLCHAYLRESTDADKSFRRALSINPSITLPPGSPSRIQKMFDEARSSGGSAPPPMEERRAAPPPVEERRTEPPPVEERRTEPPPVEERRAEPPKRRMSFGGFSMRRREPPPPVEERRTEPPPVEERREPPPVEERREPPKRRTVAAIPEGDLTPTEPKKPASGGSNTIMLVLGGISATIAAGLLAGGIISGVMAGGAIATGKNPNTSQIDAQKLQSDAQSQALTANILYGVAGAAAIGAVVFFILSPNRSKPAPTPTSFHALPPSPLASENRTLLWHSP